MAGKDKKRGFPRSILGNIIEAGGEYTGDKIGKLVMENLMKWLPFLENMAAGLGKTGKEALSLLPYIFTIPVESELSQDTWQGFMRGLVDVVKNRDAIPDDPGAQKGWFVTHLKPLFDKAKTEGKTGGEKPKPLGLPMAAVGLELHEQGRLWKYIKDAGKEEAIRKVAFGTYISTDELRVIIGMGPVDCPTWLLERLTPPPKPASALDRIQKVTNRLGAEGEKYLDPKSSEWTGAIGQINAHTNTVDMSLDFINRNTKR